MLVMTIMGWGDFVDFIDNDLGLGQIWGYDDATFTYDTSDCNSPTPSSVSELQQNCKNCGKIYCESLGQMPEGDSRKQDESCRGSCEDFRGLGLPNCPFDEYEDWLEDGEPICNKKTRFERAPSMCIAQGGNLDGCPMHYKQVQRCYSYAACSDQDTHRAVCLKNAYTEVDDLLLLVQDPIPISMTQDEAYLQGGDDKRKYECCAGDKIGDSLACDQGYCEDGGSGTDLSKCNSHMNRYCEILRNQFPKKNGLVLPRTGENSLTSDFQAITTETDLSVYTWLSDEYPGCACWDWDYAEFVKRQQKVVLMTSSGAKITTNLPSNMLCWFDPCVNSHSRMSWLNPSCGNLQMCIQFQNNQITAESGGHLNIGNTTIRNEMDCNFESGGDEVDKEVLERLRNLEADSDSKDGRITLYLLIGGGIICLLFIVLLLLFGGLGAKKPNKQSTLETYPKTLMSG